MSDEAKPEEQRPEPPPFDPCADLWAMQASGGTDPAVDLDHPDAPRRLAEYVTSRHPVELARVPLRSGASPTLWQLRPLTIDERSEILSLPTPKALLEAFRCAVTARMDRVSIAADGAVSGTETRATLDRGRGSDAWVKAQVALGGGALVDELGSLALQRANVHPKARRPYGLR